MKLLILRTDIKTQERVEAVGTLLSQNPVIKNWNVDINDIDNVLRIEASELLTEEEVIKLIKNQGFYCEALPD